MDRTEGLIDFFHNDKNSLFKISTDEVRDVVSLCIIVLARDDYKETLKIKAFELLCSIAREDFFPLKERWTLYWILQRNYFVSELFDECGQTLEEVYAAIYLKIENAMPASLIEGDKVQEEQDVIVIITDQFLDLKHAPTRRVLDYAYTIQKRLGISVIIINDSGFHLENFPYMNFNATVSFAEGYNRINELPYKGEKFSFYQVPVTMPDLQEIANVIYNIKKLSPRLVLNIGGSSFTSDLCRHFVRTATIACTTAMPVSMADYLVLNRQLRDTDKKKIERLQPWQKVVESVFNYIMPDENTLRSYTRKEFGVAEDEWLIVSAGNRMQEEMDDEFLEMVDRVLGELPNSHFMVIGEIFEEEQIADKFTNREKLSFTGDVEDGSQAIRLADVYIQPNRKGGGRAAFEAMYHGIPVITTRYGDVWDVCGKEFGVDSYQEMEERLKSYYKDGELFNSMREKSRERSLELEDMKGMFEKLFSNIGVEYQQGDRFVDELKFYNIFAKKKDEDFGTELKEKVVNLENKLDQLTHLAYVTERRSRDNEFAVVFNSTINGSEWLKEVSLSPGRVAISYQGLYVLYRSLDEFRPKRILEIGLGQSTRVIGAYAEYFHAQHYIVEHDKDWIEFFLDKHGAKKDTEIVWLERKETIYKGRWVHTTAPIKYYDKFAETLTDKIFDFIFVDGPQGSEEYSRVDIMEILPECLADSFVIMVDDSERPGERKTIGAILGILEKEEIAYSICEIDGMKNTVLIVSEDLGFLCSI